MSHIRKKQNKCKEVISLERLIFAAPDLFNALKSIIEYWDSVVPPEHLNDHHKAGRAAIAKATGVVA